MRRSWLLGGSIAAAALCALSAGLAAPRLADLPGKAVPGSIGVDVELVLAVDISYSMDFDELKLQREGYVEAVTSHGVPQRAEAGHARQGRRHAGRMGRHLRTAHRGAMAADRRRRRAHEAVAAEMRGAPVRRAFRTSISGALLFSAPLFDGNGFTGIRRVIDVSGDGTNNQGPLVHLTRDEVVAKGITINGLPIMLKEPQPGSVDLKDLDIYYEDCVIGGPGAFVVPIREREKFKEAIRTKLVLDIADRRASRA